MLDNFINNVEFFNVAELVPHKYGYIMNRFPSKILPELSMRGAYLSAHPSSCEIRFVKESPEDIINITIMDLNTPGNVVIMRGDRWEKIVEFKAGEIKTIQIDQSDIYIEENALFFKEDIYDKNVVRIIFEHAEFVLCSIETYGRKIRPPQKGELPKYTCLAYGSSITHGAGSLAAPLCYIAQAARLLNTQAMNKGLGGACFTEKCIADWFCSIPYDYIIFEAGTNMYGEYSLDVIEQRCKYFILKMLESHPGKYLFILEPPMRFAKAKAEDSFKRFMEIIHKIYDDTKTDKCILLEADQIQPHSSYVTTDLIHPSTFGHIMMGANLAQLIKPYLEL